MKMPETIVLHVTSEHDGLREVSQVEDEPARMKSGKPRCIGKSREVAKRMPEPRSDMCGREAWQACGLEVKGSGGLIALGLGHLIRTPVGRAD